MNIFNLFTRTVRGQEAADLGYVNPGPDGRIGGELGKLLGQTQSRLSFKSSVPPTRVVEMYQGILVETTTAPNGRQHIAIAIDRGNNRWATFRFGWRYDANWGNETTIGYNPQPEIVGGYIADIVIKLNADKTFINV